jgi:uncharacterized RDD family membrane protein YckC
MATNPYAPPRAIVTDVQDPARDIVLADRGTRFGAAMVDGLIFCAMVYVPLFLIFRAGVSAAGFAAGRPDPGAVMGPLVIGAVLTLGGFTTWCWFTIKYVKANGQSIAKRMLGIKVVRTDGTSITLSRSFWMRNLLNSAISSIPLLGVVYVLADILFIFAESRQCLHDKLADTIVVIA